MVERDHGDEFGSLNGWGESGPGLLKVLAGR